MTVKQPAKIGVNHLPEPPLEKTMDLIARLQPIAEIRLKQIRPAWCEKATL